MAEQPQRPAAPSQHISQRQRPLPLKTIGVLGGMSNIATAEYYRLLNEQLNARLGGHDNGEIIINSVNVGNIEQWIREEAWEAASEYLDGKIDQLERAGVDIIICVSNTMHRVVAPLMEKRKTPFLHIADPTGEAIRAAGLKTVGLLGTAPTMVSEILRTRWRDLFGIEIIAPNEADRELVNRIIFDELSFRQLKTDSKAHFVRIVEDMRRRGAEGVVLGCTEIFLLVGQADFLAFPVFDTTELHVRAVVEWVMEGANR